MLGRLPDVGLYVYEVAALRRLQEKGVGADAEWQSILAKRLFARADADVSASLAHLTDIFVERHHLLWKVGFCAPCLPCCSCKGPSLLWLTLHALHIIC